MIACKIFQKYQQCPGRENTPIAIVGKTWEDQYDELYRYIQSDNCVYQIGEDDLGQHPGQLGKWYVGTHAGEKIFDEAERAYRYAVENWCVDWGYLEIKSKDEALALLVKECLDEWLSEVAGGDETPTLKGYIDWCGIFKRSQYVRALMECYNRE